MPTAAAPTAAAPTAAAPTDVPPTAAPPTAAAPASSAAAPVAATGTFAVPAGMHYTFTPDSSGQVDESKWPDACKVFSDADMKAIAPKTTGAITHVGTIGSNLSGGNTPNNVKCKWSVMQPGDNADVQSYLEFNIEGIASHDAVQMQYDEDKKIQAGLPANTPPTYADRGTKDGASCFNDGGDDDECVAGDVLFTVSGLDQSQSDGDNNTRQATWQATEYANMEATAGTRFGS